MMTASSAQPASEGLARILALLFATDRLNFQQAATIRLCQPLKELNPPIAWIA
jgi:hypothetical protein